MVIKRRKVFSCGKNTNGALCQENVKTSQTIKKPLEITYPQGNETIVHCCASYGASFFITNTGKVWMSGRLTMDDSIQEPHYIHFGNVKITSLSACFNHAIAMSDDGEVFTFGNGSRGALGHGDYSSVKKPTKIKFFKGKRARIVNGGYNLSVVATDDHKLYYFGGVQKYNVPQEVPELNGKRIKQICSDGHILVLTEEGDIYGWGSQHRGQCGIGLAGRLMNASKMLLPGKASYVTCGYYHTLIRMQNGKIYGCGMGIFSNSQKPVLIPQEITWVQKIQVARFYAGFKCTFFIDYNGKVYVHGDNVSGALGVDIRKTTDLLFVSELEGVTIECIVPGTDHALFLSSRQETLFDKSAVIQCLRLYDCILQFVE